MHKCSDNLEALGIVLYCISILWCTFFLPFCCVDSELLLHPISLPSTNAMDDSIQSHLVQLSTDLVTAFSCLPFQTWQSRNTAINYAEQHTQSNQK